MRDAFGGSFMLRVFLIFLIVYVSFISIALNYARAFKVKNRVISYLEDNEISDIETMTAFDENKMREFFDTEIVGNLNYVYSITCGSSVPGTKVKCFDNYGIKIEQMNPTSANSLGVYYKVTTYVGYNIGFLRLFTGQSGTDFGFWKVSGESRLIINEETAGDSV